MRRDKCDANEAIVTMIPSRLSQSMIPATFYVNNDIDTLYNFDKQSLHDDTIHDRRRSEDRCSIEMYSLTSSSSAPNSSLPRCPGMGFSIISDTIMFALLFCIFLV